MSFQDDFTVRATRVEIAHKFHEGLAVNVELRDPKKDLWAVKTVGGLVINKDLQGDFEPQPSSRTEEWLEEFRFDKESAMEIACAYLSKKYEEVVELELKKKNRAAARTPGIQEN